VTSEQLNLQGADFQFRAALRSQSMSTSGLAASRPFSRSALQDQAKGYRR
jgi:hypothetical protein